MKLPDTEEIPKEDEEFEDTVAITADNKSRENGVVETESPSDEDPADESVDDFDTQTVISDEKLEQLLNIRDTGSDDESVLMDDEQMLERDDMIASFIAPFRQKNSSADKKARRLAKLNIMTLKRKILALLKLYVKEGKNLHLMPVLLLDTLEAVSKEVGTELAMVISQLSHSTVITNEEDGLALLQQIYDHGSKSHIRSTPSHSQCSLMVLRSLRANKISVDGACRVYAENLIQWKASGSRLQYTYFLDWLNWLQSNYRSDLAGLKIEPQVKKPGFLPTKHSANSTALRPRNDHPTRGKPFQPHNKRRANVMSTRPRGKHPTQDEPVSHQSKRKRRF